MSEPIDRFLAQSPESGLLFDASVAVEPGTWGRVAVSVRDRQSLRALVVPAGVRSATIGVFLSSGEGALALVAKSEWPTLSALRSRRTGDEGWVTVLKFERPVAVGDVVGELGRQCVWPDHTGSSGNGGLFVQVGGATEGDVPPDVLMPGQLPVSKPVATHPVTGRAPLVLVDHDGPIALGPLDERILNPIGFGSASTTASIDLATLDLTQGPTEALVRSLRPAAGVLVAFPEAPDLDLARCVAGLAMAGVPLAAAGVPPLAARLLGDAVTAALTAEVDLDDAIAREEHSLVLRRAALNTYSSFAWRRRVGDLAGVPVATHPSVSVVLATRRPEQLDFALRQVARQRGVEDLELVLAPHGFDVDPTHVQDLVGDRVAVQVVACPDTTVFGDVLAAAATAAGGDVVLKMDDDDWYAPDVIGDLLLARAYSGAQLVGMPAEFHYLAPKRMTVKRGHRSECYARFVAGGTMLVDAASLREVGSFRSVRKYVDAQLLAAISAAGGAVYRTHGLGYVLRRNASGHTWEVDLDYLLDPSRVEASWPGFAPSRLMECDDSDLPD